MTRDSDLVLVSRSQRRRHFVFFLKNQTGFHPREKVSCDVCSDWCFFSSSLTGLEEEERPIFPPYTPDNKTEKGEGGDDFWLRRGMNACLGRGLFVVTNTLQELARSCCSLAACHSPSGRRRRWENGRWAPRRVSHPGAQSPAPTSWRRPRGGPHVTHTAPGGGLGAPRFRGALPSNLYPDRRRFLHGQLEAGIFWKSSVYLKENRSYLLPPVKYYGNMSANNLLCVICSNANKQQLGHFPWWIPLRLQWYYHTRTSPTRWTWEEHSLRLSQAAGNSPHLEAVLGKAFFLEEDVLFLHSLLLKRAAERYSSSPT